jgi:outer membrane protein OmpA-like peptidoglycan-associated protein
VAPQETSKSNIEITAEKEEPGLNKIVFEQITIIYPFISGYQLGYDQDNDLKSIIITIEPEYIISVEQFNSIVSYLEKLNNNIEIEVITENISAQPVYFEKNIYEVAADEQQKLNELAFFLNAHPNYDLTVMGHADSNGDQNYNETISRMRAEAVTNYLIQNAAVAPERIATSYSVESDQEKELEEGRKEQRRVDLMIIPSSNRHVR